MLSTDFLCILSLRIDGIFARECVFCFPDNVLSCLQLCKAVHLWQQVDIQCEVVDVPASYRWLSAAMVC